MSDEPKPLPIAEARRPYVPLQLAARLVEHELDAVKATCNDLEAAEAPEEERLQAKRYRSELEADLYALQRGRISIPLPNSVKVEARELRRLPAKDPDSSYSFNVEWPLEPHVPPLLRPHVESPYPTLDVHQMRAFAVAVLAEEHIVAARFEFGDAHGGRSKAWGVFMEHEWEAWEARGKAGGGDLLALLAAACPDLPEAPVALEVERSRLETPTELAEAVYAFLIRFTFAGARDEPPKAGKDREKWSVRERHQARGDVLRLSLTQLLVDEAVMVNGERKVERVSVWGETRRGAPREQQKEAVQTTKRRAVEWRNQRGWWFSSAARWAEGRDE